MILLAVIVAALFGILAVIAMTVIDAGQRRFTDFVERDAARVAAFNTMYAQGLQSGQAVRNILLDPPNRKAYDNLANAGRAFEAAFEEARKLSLDQPAILATLKSIETLERKNNAARDAVLADVAAGRIPEAHSRLNSEETPAWRELKQVLLDGMAELGRETDRARANLAADASERRMQIQAVGAIGLAAVLLVSLLIAHNILRQLGGEPAQAAEVANRIARGDLSANINLRSGDTTSLMHAMKRMRDAVAALADDADRLAKAAVVGHIGTRADASRHEGQFRLIIEDTNAALDRIVGLLDNLPTPVLAMDRDFRIVYINDFAARLGGKTPAQAMGARCHDHFRAADCHTSRCAAKRAMDGNRPQQGETVARPGDRDLHFSTIGLPICDTAGKIVGAFELIADQTAIRNAMRTAAKVAEYQAAETENLIDGLDRIAGGDLTVALEPAPGDADTAAVRETYEKVAAAVNGTVARLAHTIAAVRAAAEMLAAATQQVSATAQNLAQAASEEAASIDATAAGVGAEQIDDVMTRMNLLAQQNASSAEELAATAEEMSAQADGLQRLIAFFTLPGEKSSAGSSGAGGNQGASRPIRAAQAYGGSMFPLPIGQR